MEQILSYDEIYTLLNERDLECGFQTFKDLPKPFSLKGMQEGIAITKAAIEAKKEILVVGDYDADGVCASAIMSRFFTMLGYTPFRLVIPNRFSDGYGVSVGLLEQYLGEARLVISVDNGISAFEAAEFCAERGVEFIITDHHIPSDKLPNAHAIINPHQKDCPFPQKEICGAAVAWYFCAGLKQALRVDIDLGGVFIEWLCIATISDIMPLVGINRLFVKRGLELLSSSNSPCGKFLQSKCKNLYAIDIAFKLAPLLNCAGRMESAYLAFEFLISSNATQMAQNLHRLESLNAKRKAVQQEIFTLALKPRFESEHFVLSVGEGWHEGVLGIVAAKLSEEYGKSAFVLCRDNGMCKGSGRSAGGINLIECLKAFSESSLDSEKACDMSFGGHSGAVGLKISSCGLETFLESLECNLVYTQSMPSSHALPIAAQSISLELVGLLESFEPFGAGNEKPVFVCDELLLQSVKPIGRTREHYAYELVDSENGETFRAVEFFAPKESAARGAIGERVCVRFELGRDEWRGGSQLKILELSRIG